MGEATQSACMQKSATYVLRLTATCPAAALSYEWRTALLAVLLWQLRQPRSNKGKREGPPPTASVAYRHCEPPAGPQSRTLVIALSKVLIVVVGPAYCADTDIVYHNIELWFARIWFGRRTLETECDVPTGFGHSKINYPRTRRLLCNAATPPSSPTRPVAIDIYSWTK